MRISESKVPGREGHGAFQDVQTSGAYQLEELEVTGEPVVCWKCHTVAAVNASECPNCGVGVSLRWRNIEPEEFHREQADLRRKLGIESASQNIRLIPPCGSCGFEISDYDTVFCRRCGERVLDDESAALMSRVLDAFQAVVPGLVQEGISKSAEKFSWDNLPTEEKWKLTWGVWGRQILVNIAFWVGLMVIGFAIAGVLGS